MTEDTTAAPDLNAPTKPPHRPLADQLRASAIGEATGVAVGIGTVYLSNLVMPHQTRQFSEWLSKLIGRFWKSNIPDIAKAGQQMQEAVAAQVGGLANMTAQYCVRRANTPEDERKPLSYELGRLAVGRVFGTVTSLSAFGLAEARLPKTMRHMENVIAEAFPGKVNDPTHRFSTLLVSNVIQSGGALAGNVPAQLLYDYLVGDPTKGK